VAQEMLRARDLAVVYTPSFWWVIMSVIHLLPDRAFERLSL
jgi:hypothetical protein